ncbi:Hypothetical protein A7982_09154 [Minicystis rosea]|nr:Hypothetical protein A7982_09154 [Minicystis rosea]
MGYGMHPLVRGAAAAAVLTALGSLDRSAPPAPPGSAPDTEVRGVDGLPAPCLPGTLPEGPVCVRIPEGEANPVRLEAEPPRSGGRAGVETDRIARRPDRPADPTAYTYPVGNAARAPRILSGLDAHGEKPGFRVAARPSEKVVLLALDQQSGPAEVVLTGDLFGPTIVTRHEIAVGNRKHSVLLIHGNLDRFESGVTAGETLEPGATLGFARAENGGALVEIYVEARQLRDGATLDPKKLTDPSTALPIDLRDVLPLRPR